MKCIRKGSIVSRKSYNDDILFYVENIINTTQGKYAILKGITLRIKANAPLNDLNIVEKYKVKKEFEKLEKRIEEQILENRYINIMCGKILHLDGDRKYAEKSARYYKKIGLNAIVRNIPESRQPFMVKNLIKKYKPDILIITGHDGMIKNGTGFTDIYNYRNSRHFINTVIEARKWGRTSNKLVIFAGACQSFFEAIMEAGADFASSPARILIDFMDPLIVAERIAITDEYKFVSIREIAKHIKEGEKGIGGIGANGKRKSII